MNYGSRHSGNGGEFNASSANFVSRHDGLQGEDNHNGEGVETFAWKRMNISIPGSTYNYGISQGAIHGGVSGGDPDLISRGTAWLYLQFAQGTLAGYNYSIGVPGNASAGALQSTIWSLEGEGGTPNNAFSSLVTGDLANYTADNNGHLRCGRSQSVGPATTQAAQDQLILTRRTRHPDGGTTIMLLGVAL